MTSLPVTPEHQQPAPADPLGPRAAASLVFFSAAAVLVLEILSLRLVAPYLGLTLETSTAVIGVSLAAIATGAWVGGRAADTLDPSRALGPLIAISGALVLVVAPAVRWTGELVRGGEVSAVLLVAAVAVFAPAALLSAVSPMVVKLRLATLAETGTVVGRLSGIGTAGAIFGTFLCGFVLVAALPTSLILLGLGTLLLAAGVVAALRLRRLRPGAGPLAGAVLGGAATLLAPPVCDLETAYHCARVVADPARPTGRVLELDTLRHSYVDLADPRHLEFAYVRAIAAATDVHRPVDTPVRALHVGGGGLTLPRYLAAARPGSDSRVFEIDAGVVEVDRSRLGFTEGNGIEVRVQDGRVGLTREPAASRDVVVGDAFGGLSVPWHLTTREAVADVRRVLVPGGLYAVNVIDYPPLAFARAEVATLAAQFEHVAVAARPQVLDRRGGGNLVLLTSDRPLPLAALRARMAATVPEYALLSGDRELAAFVGDARELTDDFAPVDQLLTPYARTPG
jgi:spermidine synthase